MPVNNSEVPPILSSGKGSPVIGPKPAVTAIFTMACITSAKLNPADNKPPNGRVEMATTLMPRYNKAK